MSTTLVPTTAELETDLEAAEVQSAFYSKFILLALERRRPGFSTKLTRKVVVESKSIDVSTRIDGAAISDKAEKMVAKQVMLLPEAAGNLLNAAYGKVDQFVANPDLTQPFRIKGLRILPIARRDAFFGGWPAIRDGFREDVERFFSIYEADVVAPAREYWLPILGEPLFDKLIGPHLPPLAQLRGKFGVRVVPGVFNYEDAADAADALQELADDVRDQLESALSDLAEKLRGGARLSVDSLNEMKRALGAARSFSDVVDPALLAQVRSMERKLDRVTVDVEARARTNGLTMTKIIRGSSSVLNEAIASMTAAVRRKDGVAEAMARFGASPRVIRKD